MQNNNNHWYYYMDNLRALALLLGIFFHAAIAYSPIMGDLWPAGDFERSSALDFVTWFSHMFRMPLFFLISGFFAYMLLQKRGIKPFVKHRSMRILLPFIIFLPLVIASILGSVIWAAENIENKSNFLKLIIAMFSNPNAEQPPFSTTHLWFLYNLFMFCLVAALLWKYRGFQSQWMGRLCTPKTILLIFPLLLIPSLASVPMPHPAAERIYPEIWSFGFYGLYFLLGFMIYHKQSLLDELKPYAHWLLLLSLGLYYVWFIEISQRTFTIETLFNHQFRWQDLPYAAIEALISVFMTVCCLVYGKLFLDRKNAILRVLSQSSYWVYIVHLPVLFWIQFLLLDVELNLWLKFSISSFGTLAIGIISYYLLVKWTPIGWLLNGRKKN